MTLKMMADMNHAWHVIVVEGDFTNNADGDVGFLKFAHKKLDVCPSHFKPGRSRCIRCPTLRAPYSQLYAKANGDAL